MFLILGKYFLFDYIGLANELQKEIMNILEYKISLIL